MDTNERRFVSIRIYQYHSYIRMFKKKSLGQHFLRDPRILKKVVDAAALSPEDTIVEVGPGEGTLTELLVERAGKVIAIEKDDRLIPLLKEKFSQEMSAGRLELIHDDILSLPTNYSLLTTNYKIVANLPYYITGQFFRQFLQETAKPPLSMTLLLQKEVARRIIAANGKESILSISIKAYGTPRYVDTVKAGSFSPPPKVDSAILSIDGISKRFFETGADGHLPAVQEDAHPVREREQRFFETVRRGFAHPRKFVTSNLGLGIREVQVLGIHEKARAESLSLRDWKNLTVLREKASPDPNTRE